ncbi:MAG TPA: ZIP family metal transporter [Ruminococcaceae bacterium]|nr:ZIP family metal transporter [Oscillospiraceae bacterium]
MIQNVVFALIATIITWLFTLFGALTTMFFKKSNSRFLYIVMSFSAGIMIASSIWSLLCPAIELTNGVYVIISMLVGTVLLYYAETKITKFRNLQRAIKRTDKELLMMIISITIHNIPEGLAVGLAFGSIVNASREGLISAIALTIGIAIQNFPEGAAISLPLMSSGLSKKKSFFIGQASALVEPVFGVIGALAVTISKMLIPYCFGFAAGCMIFVVIEDLIPQAIDNGKKAIVSFSFITGFSVMMLLDVML